ncbi:hypothetical protein AVEN_118066-1 [Araneus ventricosus]|uniref:Uncharacterized protein n=1 Tax=Araneus ventricosus TaxID=182803 RepID=A0A4Y2NNX6_ARAVE|nr:hypothetical protein AVEN_118066-1 [Araneus ventricosus]
MLHKEYLLTILVILSFCPRTTPEPAYSSSNLHITSTWRGRSTRDGFNVNQASIYGGSLGELGFHFYLQKVKGNFDLNTLENEQNKFLKNDSLNEREEEVSDFVPTTVIFTEHIFCFNSYQSRCPVMGSYQRCCLGTDLTLREYQKYHFHIVSSLKMIENAWEGLPREPSLLLLKKLWSESVVDYSETVPYEAYSQRGCFWPRSGN